MTEMTRVLRVDALRPDPAAIGSAADCLRRGGLVAFPTETVYGLGVHALDAAAVHRLFQAKQRPAHDPLIVHIRDFGDVGRLAINVPDGARMLAARFWPGPLTLVLQRAAIVPDAVTAGLETVALRVPAHPVAAALIAAAAIPVAAPSANLFSRPSPTRAEHVLQDLDGRIDLVLDGGPATVGVESTVLDLSRTPPTVLRPGAVTMSMLREVLPDVVALTAVPAEDAPMPSPGLLSKHYSPRVPFTLYEGPSQPAVLARLLRDAESAVREGRRVGLVLAEEDEKLVARLAEPRKIEVRYLGREADAEQVATRLFGAIRDLDALNVDLILARSFPAEGLGAAVLDRMRRAAAGRIVLC
jgi:L-threonylcarbamoyladenylate synthase